MPSPLTIGTLLHRRYRLKGALARGEFGFIYVAEDQKRANELCTLEEFIPSDAQPDYLEHLRAYFQTEIHALIQLNHPQILRSRVVIADAQRLFLVQDDIVASPYREILRERLAAGIAFSEVEVRQLLTDLLPVLTYLHDRRIRHGNLCLDSILLQESDHLPVLTNFGILRKLAVECQFQSVNPAWSSAWFNAQSHRRELLANDVYDLATVALDLLTGQETDPGVAPNLSGAWRERVTPPFARLLRQLLQQPSRRYPSVQQVIKVVEALPEGAQGREIAGTQPRETQTGSWDDRLHPIGDGELADHRPDRSAQPQAEENQATFAKGAASAIPAPSFPPHRDFSLPILTAIFSILVGLLTWRVAHLLPKQPETQTPTVAIAPSARPIDAEQMQGDVRDQRKQLGIRYALFTSLVDELFYIKHPDWVNRPLNGAEGATLKAEWNQLAKTLLSRLATLSAEARQDMGTYNRAAYDRWLLEAKPPVKRQTVESLADAQFLRLFPEQQGKAVNPRKLGQVWYAIARDQIKTLQQTKNDGS